MIGRLPTVGYEGGAAGAGASPRLFFGEGTSGSILVISGSAGEAFAGEVMLAVPFSLRPDKGFPVMRVVDGLTANPPGDSGPTAGGDADDLAAAVEAEPISAIANSASRPSTNSALNFI